MMGMLDHGVCPPRIYGNFRRDTVMMINKRILGIGGVRYFQTNSILSFLAKWGLNIGNTMFNIVEPKVCIWWETCWQPIPEVYQFQTWGLNIGNHTHTVSHKSPKSRYFAVGRFAADLGWGSVTVSASHVLTRWGEPSIYCKSLSKVDGQSIDLPFWRRF